MANLTTRHDPRYVESRDPRAVLVAWAHDAHDMGGWTDHNADDFQAAIRDAWTENTGYELISFHIAIHEKLVETDEDEEVAEHVAA